MSTKTNLVIGNTFAVPTIRHCRVIPKEFTETHSGHHGHNQENVSQLKKRQKFFTMLTRAKL